MAALYIPTPDSPIDYHLSNAEDNTHKNKCSTRCDQDDIPYHAREYAKPFTYGNLPDAFKKSELYHDETEKDVLKSNNVKPEMSTVSSSSNHRTHNRPSISPSQPVLRKTPSREEFEKMLMERREESAREKNSFSTKLPQYLAIQKDLNGLQDKITKSAFAKIATEEPKKEDETLKPHKICNGSIQPVTERPETPAFPSELKGPLDRCVSPYPLGSFTNASSAITAPDLIECFLKENDQKNVIQPFEIEQHLVKFAKNYSEFWFKPYMTRKEAVSVLRNAKPGDFLIRNSTTHKNAFGLVLRVAKPPTGVELSDQDELVRHFLIKANTLGVYLKGCPKEPLFTSLSALVYEHSVNCLALPCTLNIPNKDILHCANDDLSAVHKHGAACNVLYLFAYKTESLTGKEAVRKAVSEMYLLKSLPIPVEIHFKVSQQGITLTDNKRRKFFRQFYDAKNISHFDVDPDNRLFNLPLSERISEGIVNKTIFAFVARPLVSCRDNECHVFCDLSVDQPASAIVSFAKKVLPLQISGHKML